MLGRCSWSVLVVGAFACVAPSAHASDWRVAGELGYSPRFFGTSHDSTLGIGAALTTGGGALELAGGGRLAIGRIEPNPGFSGFVSASLCGAQRTFFPAVGYWVPAVGLELEATTGSADSSDSKQPPGSLARAFTAKDDGNVLRVALLVAPARWQWGKLFVSVGALRFATPVGGEMGRRLYVNLSGSVGWRL